MTDQSGKIKSATTAIQLVLLADVIVLLAGVFVFMKRGGASADNFPDQARLLHVILGAVNTGFLFRLLQAAGRRAWLGTLLSFIAALFCAPVQWMLLGGYISKVRSSLNSAEPAQAAPRSDMTEI